MATGKIPKYITPWKAGDSFTVASGQGSYTGFLAYKYTARCVIPLTKPVEPGVVVRVSGSIAIRAVGSNGIVRTSLEYSTNTTSANYAGASFVTATVTDCGLAVDFSKFDDGQIDKNADFGTMNSPCSVGSAGMIITFVASS